MDLTKCHKCVFNQYQTCNWLRLPQFRPDIEECSCYIKAPMPYSGPTVIIESLPCPKCGKITSTSVPDHIGQSLVDKEGHIQDLLAIFDASFRERFITGTCETCWKEVFEKDKEELIFSALWKE